VPQPGTCCNVSRETTGKQLPDEYVRMDYEESRRNIPVRKDI
jgi:hypothetical protein